MDNLRFSPPERTWAGLSALSARPMRSSCRSTRQRTSAFGQAEVARAEGRILEDRFAHDLGLGVLEHHAHDETGMQAVPGDGHAVDDDLSAGRREEAVHVAEEQSLAAAVSAGHEDELAPRDFEAHGVQPEGAVAEAVRYAAQLDEAHRCPGSAASGRAHRAMATAAAALSASPGRKGSRPTVAARARGMRAAKANHGTPTA